MNCNTQNAKIASITEKTLIVGIDVGSETHYARAFDWRNYEYTEYSCAVKPHIRAGGNRQSGIQETVIASLLA